MGRELPVQPGTDLVIALRRYLRRGDTTTARELSQKAAILLEPEDRMGTVVWPRDGGPSAA
jgi:hypothetical protein